MLMRHVDASSSRKPGHLARFGSPACLCMAGVILSLASSVQAYDSQSDGSDGPFNPQSNRTIDLGLAINGHWRDTPGTGFGVYDAEQWAVVFKFTTIDIPAGVTVTFNNHPKHAPVVWLASGDVNIEGTVNLNGKNGGSFSDPVSYADGGPGGFSGGKRAGSGSLGASSGMGPGGARSGNSFFSGGFGTAGEGSGGGIAYGSPSLVPLIGGSGGEGGTDFGASGGGGGGGGGGGAILIASSGQIIINSSGRIIADGGVRGPSAPGNNNGAGHGSGGGIRLVADLVTGGGSLLARSGNPGVGFGLGRIRIDGANALTGMVSPQEDNGDLAPLFPDSNAPKLRATVVHNTAVPEDPRGLITSDDVLIGAPNIPVTVQIQAENVQPGATVQIRIARANGDSTTVVSTPLEGEFALSTATATVTFPVGSSAVYLRTTSP